MDEDKKTVALEYGKNKTPKLIAKGDYEIAQLIIDEAKKHGIFITEDAELVAYYLSLKLMKTYQIVFLMQSQLSYHGYTGLKGMVPGDEKK